QKTKVVIPGSDANHVEAGGVNFPINNNGALKIRWFGDYNNFPTVSLKEIFEASDDDDRMQFALKDNIIFVASTAYGAHDLRHTPVNAQMPGIYTHMNVVNQLLDGRAFKPTAESVKLTWI